MTEEPKDLKEEPSEQPEFEMAPETSSQPAPPVDIKKKPARRAKRTSLFFPLLLIAIGVVFLLRNLNVVTGDAWDLFIKLWPLILIAWGLDSIWKGDGLTGSIFLIGLGSIFLLSNFGYLDASIWQIVLSLWPVLLIAIGLEILISRRRSIWLQLLGLLIILAVLAGSLWLSGITISSGRMVEAEQISINLQGASQAEVKLIPGAGNLYLDQLSTTGILLAGTLPESTSGRTITQDFSLRDERATLTLRSTGAQVVTTTGKSSENTWDLGVTTEIPLDLVVDLSAGDVTLDLTGLDILKLDANMGAGDLTIVLPQEGNFDIDVRAGVGQVTIVVPEGIGVQLNTQTGLVSRSIPAGFIKQSGQAYLSPDFVGQEDQVRLKINLAIGQLTVRFK